jgi:respiratory nitrate reductase gamma subunit
MESLLRSLDQILFAVLPYVVVVVFLLLGAARRYSLPPFGRSRHVALPQSGLPAIGERILFGYGILVVLGGHLLAFLIPQQILWWNSDPLRLYVLEATGLAFGLMTLAGLLLAVGGRLLSKEARQATRLVDWCFFALLLFVLANGVLLALIYPWGSSWFATSLVPYLRSVVRLEPDIAYVSALPVPVKLHVLAAYVLICFLPFTRLVRPLVGSAGETERRGTNQYLMTTILLVGLGAILLAIVPRLESAHLPGNDQGYEPVQPIAFSHRLHAGDLQISCFYCHYEADKSPHAGFPAASVCMNCHRFVTAPLSAVRAEFELARQEKRPARTVVSSELEKLYTALGLNDKLQPDPAKTPSLLRWVKVHNPPAFTHFDHRAHVNAGVACQHCHGQVESMERVRQVEDLSMGWCVHCHNDVSQKGLNGKELHASNDCTTCHH